MEMVIFFILAVIALAAAVGVIAQRSAVRSALFLLVNFCCLAGLYILLNAQFVAVAQVIIYAGAIVVLFLFVVMLLGMERAEEAPGRAGQSLRRYQWVAGVLLGLLFLAGVIWALIPAEAETIQELVPADNVWEIGAALMTDFAIPFELASVVLLVAIIGAVVLAKKRLEG
ncbi:MAG: NADH-quinone oxidoreductase subunit J [Anaerolineae bacterium]|jgi:NADH-quinone oxidoreductase subunit J